MKYFQSSRYPIELILSENLDKQYHMHNHVNHWILATVISGNVVVEISNDKKECTYGEYFVLPPYVPHALYLNKNARMLSLCVQKNFLDQIDLVKLRSVVQIYIEELHERNIITQEFGKKFVCLLGKLYEKEIIQNNSNKDIEKIINLIVYNPEVIFTLDELAEKAHINKFQLIKNFKREIGISPHQFCIQNRIRKGQLLLRKKIKILDVSMEMGFYDQSHFDRAFQKIVGISPTEYIQSSRLL